MKKFLKLSRFFVAIGFIGAAIRYWQWWPSRNLAYGITCPLCPNMDSVGTQWEKFWNYTFVGGVMNLLPSLATGWLIVGFTSLARVVGLMKAPERVNPLRNTDEG